MADPSSFDILVMKEPTGEDLPKYSFSQEDAAAAWRTWGANCGPGALAALLQVSLDAVRPALAAAGFEDRPCLKRYTSPTIMRAALETLGCKIAKDVRGNPEFTRGGSRAPASTPWPNRGLVRVQWTGPWTAPGANPRWAYGATHWVCAWGVEAELVVGKTRLPASSHLIFDINTGWNLRADWERETVPLILKDYKRADGGWYPTHLWEVALAREQSVGTAISGTGGEHAEAPRDGAV